MGGWMDPIAGLDDVEKRKFLNLPGLELQPLGLPAPVASRYTDYAVPAPICVYMYRNIVIQYD
jgi:hypothetical protein